MFKGLKEIINPIDPSKITGPYALLAVFLLVLQVSIGVWFAAANSATERIIAGLIFAALFLGFLYVLVRLQNILQRTTPSISEQTGEISTENIANEEVPQEQIESPEAQLLTAPDGSFDIHEPPIDWEVKELTMSEWMNENLGIGNPSPEEELHQPPGPKVLVFEAKRRTYVIPVPGTTRSEGRLIPSALELAIPTRLAIMPMERYQPPFFIERSLIHSLVTAIAQPVFLQGPLTLRMLRRDRTKNTNRELIEVGFFQNMENAIVNGKDGCNLTSTVTCIAIEGFVRDHALVLNYVFVPTDEENPELGQEVNVLQSLVNSFRPLKVFNRDERREEINREMDQRFEQTMEQVGEDILYTEFTVLLRRLRGQDIDDPETRLKVMRLLKNFERLANQVNLENETFDELWHSLRQAEQGDATELKTQFHRLMNRNAVHLLVTEAFNKGNLSVIDECVETTYVNHLEDPETPLGPEGVRDDVTFWRTVLGNLQLNYAELIIEGDKVAFRWTMSGIHQDEIMGIAPTDNEVTFTGTTIYRFAAGKIVEEWTVSDEVGLLRQIGYPLPVAQAED